MKLLFIENRHKTYFFEPIAKQLIKKGHDIHWLVQNKQFTPSSKANKYVIDYPPKKINGFKKNKSVEDVIKSDRQCNHFNKQDTSYFYYYNDKIVHYLKILKPDFVFGESTAFHELLTINNCRKQGILYLNPSTCRYPIGRFSFYLYDTLEPFKGSGELLEEKEAQEVVDQIVYRKSMPDYMKPVSVSKKKKVKDQLKKVFSYIKGERYNTPNPITKYKIEKLKEGNIAKWDALASNNIDNIVKQFKILYPLQMQPEANIDVWGGKYRNQAALINNIAKTIPEDAVLFVKPNPKSKYELSDALFEVIANNKNILALKHTTKMDAVLPAVDMVITVTGTIAIECILSNIPIINLVKTINHKAKNCGYINTIHEELISEINKVKEDKYLKLNRQEKIDFINVLNSTSFKGMISDPFSDTNCLSTENTENVLKAFNNILNQK